MFKLIGFRHDNFDGGKNTGGSQTLILDLFLETYSYRVQNRLVVFWWGATGKLLLAAVPIKVNLNRLDVYFNTLLL